jgi:hypothetical protein
MKTVSQPPRLIAQQTTAWCFAAAEQMVRRYYGLPDDSQWTIADRLCRGLAALDPGFQERWVLAISMDEFTGQQPQGGNNLSSAVVGLVRNQYGAVNVEATGGRYLPLTAKLVREQIDANRIFVIGTAIHYYVVYGYDDDGSTLLVRDPWPKGTGGLTSKLTLAEFGAEKDRVAIVYDGLLAGRASA